MPSQNTRKVRLGVRTATLRRSDRSLRGLRSVRLAIARPRDEPEGSADCDLVDVGNGPEPTLQVGSLQVQRPPHVFAPELGQSNEARSSARRLLCKPDLVAVQAVQEGCVVRSEHELSPAGIGLGILEDLDQSTREPRVKTRVDLIEQKNPTVLERKEHRTYQTEPSLGSDGFILQIESNRFTVSAVNEAKAMTWPRRAPGLFFGYLEIGDPRICEAKQVQGKAWICNRWRIFGRAE